MTNAYKQAGVDITAGYEAVDRIKQHVKRTIRPEVLGGIGAFGGAVDLSALNIKEPVLVSGTDGVGTKLMIAIEMDRHDTIGIDAVAMCVNDIVTQGAEPLYFLDYIACGILKPEKIEAIVKGVADGCEQSGCSLIGGETAEMPGMYSDADFDIAGFAVGVVEKSKMITGEHIQDGDQLIGIASNGIHSNGFSLVRKIVQDAGHGFDDRFGEGDMTIGDELLKPTRLYVKPVLELLKKYDIKGLAHITGGGLYENVPRMLPSGAGAVINLGSWDIPDIFRWLSEKGSILENDMYSTFNMGIGMVAAVKEEDVKAVIAELKEQGEQAYHIGHVTSGKSLLLKGEDHA
ncbi:phosphoribosylformylglycinamidine cyclo-ligase [Scopulibacillus darangshiensis]|uniref:Phosphoribosylformylglycinamidine cyclo-ligase n=1 Tax=Scopulibacillus darangshiensis TaxID=442528 RepID=A0A4R2NRP5_9BACL|nr:phosphoribosylformylglycinamidine cyclo-ligase [Scopulibacillus darangshiensis]TCP24104.1 phosphoribosylformylglycinamidine cyclo-ligase [Scopulibacillus darangshiensis]